MKADAKKIKWLLDNEKQKSIERETGIAQSKLSRIKSGDIKMKNITFEVASTLTEYAEKVLKKEQQNTWHIIQYCI